MSSSSRGAPERESFVLADLDWVSAVAAQVSAALESVDHATRVEQLAQTDSMTGLANRRALDVWLDGAMVQWRDHQTPIGLTVVDLNGLKRINDDQGHDAGDRVLRQLAQILQEAAQRFDHALVARLGGDEFCIAVSGSDAPDLVDGGCRGLQRGLGAPAARPRVWGRGDDRRGGGDRVPRATAAAGRRRAVPGQADPVARPGGRWTSVAPGAGRSRSAMPTTPWCRTGGCSGAATRRTSATSPTPRCVPSTRHRTRRLGPGSASSPTC